VLLKQPEDGSWEALKDNIPKFIAYWVPFEAAANAENLLLQEWTDSIQSVSEFRVYPISQEDLWQDGLEMPEAGEAPSLDMGIEHGKYSDGKWGADILGHLTFCSPYLREERVSSHNWGDSQW
jgi:hypothetical protein